MISTLRDLACEFTADAHALSLALARSAAYREAKGRWNDRILAQDEPKVDVHQVPIPFHHNVVVVAVTDPEHVRRHAVASRRSQEVLPGVLDAAADGLTLGLQPAGRRGVKT